MNPSTTDTAASAATLAASAADAAAATATQAMGFGHFIAQADFVGKALLGVLVASVGGYQLGARQDAAAMAGRRVLIWALVGTCC